MCEGVGDGGGVIVDDDMDSDISICFLDYVMCCGLLLCVVRV
jgi:hypothetical protein